MFSTVTGMEHAGIDLTHMNHLVTTLDIPAVDPKLLRCQENITISERQWPREAGG